MNKKVLGEVMKRKEKIFSTTLRTESREKDGIGYEYELIMKESARVASFKIPLYSVSVKMTDENGETTHANTKDVFADPGKALVFYEKLVKNLATPIDLAYILEDEF